MGINGGTVVRNTRWGGLQALVFATLLASVMIAVLALPGSASSITVSFLCGTDTALVKHVQPVELNAGRNRIVIAPLSTSLLPGSLHSYTDGAQVLEQRLVAPSTLALRLEAVSDVTCEVTTSYLTTGISWQIVYLVLTHRQSSGNWIASVDAQVLIENDVLGSWPDVTVQLMEPIHFSERLRDTLEQRSFSSTLASISPGTQWQEAPAYTPSARMNQYDDYVVYTFFDTVDLIQDEIQYLHLFSIDGLEQKSSYVLDGDRFGDEIRHNLSLHNPLHSANGVFFPGGIASIYQVEPDNTRLYLGQQQVPQLLFGQEAQLDIGPARGIQGYRVQTSYRETKLDALDQAAYGEEKAREYSYEIILVNLRAQPVTIDVLEHLYGYWQIIQSDPNDYKRLKQGIRYHIEVPIESQRIIRYTARTI